MLRKAHGAIIVLPPCWVPCVTGTPTQPLWWAQELSVTVAASPKDTQPGKLWVHLRWWGRAHRLWPQLQQEHLLEELERALLQEMRPRARPWILLFNTKLKLQTLFTKISLTAMIVANFSYAPFRLFPWVIFLNPNNNPMRRCYYLLHFTGMETEVNRGLIPCPRSLSCGRWWWWRLGIWTRGLLLIALLACPFSQTDIVCFLCVQHWNVKEVLTLVKLRV